MDIVMDPDDWHTAYVIDVGGKLWRTIDTGTTFQNVTGTLSDVGALRSLEYFAGGNGDYVLVGADAGVFIASMPWTMCWWRGPWDAAPGPSRSLAQSWIRIRLRLHLILLSCTYCWETIKVTTDGGRKIIWDLFLEERIFSVPQS